ncbi:MAG: homoserine O-succinyltransferase [Alphaproteobacteria bacterium]|nr:homoserine O-succinyltransferase [Alphaproteobacteria bacterium]
MPIKIHDNLPARTILLNELVDVIDSSSAEKQDIRPLRFLLLNLMPKKLQTEVQFARLIGASPLQIELTLMTTKTYAPKNTKKEHLIEFYKTLDEIKGKFYDVLIITGAPVEIVSFEDVQYWNELKKIIEWSSKNVFRRIGICWGAQALLHVLHGIDKHTMDEKLFGVYDHNLNQEKKYRLLQGFIDRFPMPVSRYTETRDYEVKNAGLEILAFSKESGVGMVRCPKTKDLFILNHLEYDAITLKEEFIRDKSEKISMKIPENYFPDNDVLKDPINRWRPYAFLLFSNFINEVYQDVPYSFCELGVR